MPLATECLKDMKQESVLTPWQPNPNSLLTCMDYPSFPCDLGKKGKGMPGTVFEATMQTEIMLQLGIKWGKRERHQIYLLSGSRESSRNQDTLGRRGKQSTCPTPVQRPKERCCLSCYYCSPRIQPSDGWMSYFHRIESHLSNIGPESVGESGHVP